MDQKTANRLEKEVEKSIADVITRLGLRHLPLLPSHDTLRRMAKAAVAEYKTALEQEQ